MKIYNPITEGEQAVKDVGEWVDKNPPASMEACLAFVEEQKAIPNIVVCECHKVTMEDFLEEAKDG